MTLRIGLLVDGVLSSKYVYDLITWARGQEGLEISHLIILRNPNLSPIRKATRILREFRIYDFLGAGARRLVIMIEKSVLKLYPEHKDHFDSFDISGTVARQVTINPIVSPSGLVYRFSKSDIEKIRSLNIDVLVRCGFGILRGDILRCCKFGVLSFHHGDNRINRGGHAGFLECYHKWPQTGFIIQQLTEELDGGKVLFRGAFKTRFFFSLNQAELLARSNVYLKDLLKKMAFSNSLPRFEDGLQLYDRPLFRPPSFYQVAMYCGKIFFRIPWRLGRQLVGLRVRWSLALLNGSFEKAVLWRSKEIRPPKGRSWAEPFLCSKDGTTCCFIEDYVYRDSRAHITALEICDGAVRERGIAIEEDFHLSFPFIFEYERKLFMCPGSVEAKQIRLYVCEGFPLKWTLHGVLMDGVAATNTMIFQNGTRWWMLTNVDRSSTGDHCSELHLFYAACPLDKMWTPHPQNPVKVDSFGGRNGGMAVLNGKLYRFGQQQGFGVYGKGLMIYEITKLSELEYQERLLQDVSPNFRKRLLGVHHMTSNGLFTVIDQSRFAFAGR